jgi:hypothetical protein
MKDSINSQSSSNNIGVAKGTKDSKKKTKKEKHNNLTMDSNYGVEKLEKKPHAESQLQRKS